MQQKLSAHFAQDCIRHLFEFEDAHWIGKSAGGKSAALIGW
jgi:hypothetical protein